MIFQKVIFKENMYFTLYNVWNIWYQTIKQFPEQVGQFLAMKYINLVIPSTFFVFSWSFAKYFPAIIFYDMPYKWVCFNLKTLLSYAWAYMYIYIYVCVCVYIYIAFSHLYTTLGEKIYLYPKMLFLKFPCDKVVLVYCNTIFFHIIICFFHLSYVFE